MTKHAFPETERLVAGASQTPPGPAADASQAPQGESTAAPAPLRGRGDPGRAADQPAPEGRPARLISLDAFRGLAILGMLVVNEKEFGPATPAHLRHAGWEGLHLADLVFPWFLFIVGVAIPYAAAARRTRANSRWEYCLRVVRRTVILVLLGALINSSYAGSPVWNMGVLQLIGLAYFVGALLYGLAVQWRLGVAAALLLGYWLAIRFVPIPGVGSGVFTQDQNLIKYLDEAYLRHYHLNGILLAVTATALVLIGTAIGDLLRRESDPPLRKVSVLFATGVGLVVVGWLWSLDLAFNKPVWTASYVVFAAGWASLLLGLLYLVIDVKGWRAWAFPLAVAGMNAIFAYVAPILTNLHILREWRWQRVPLEDALKGVFFEHAGRVPGGILYTFCYIFLWWLVLLWMYRKRVFLRV
jgi:predicted acyltransferase